MHGCARATARVHLTHNCRTISLEEEREAQALMTQRVKRGEFVSGFGKHQGYSKKSLTPEELEEVMRSRKVIMDPSLAGKGRRRR
jgi:hypothetical protein